ncbi:hypothetical protein [Mesorhizobium sp. M0138]|uniref:DUF2958 domain-containing protein n=1 Tax=Mesorhizobium sp. M0138 TaxID=2956891 RepID=UPI003339FEE1
MTSIRLPFGIGIERDMLFGIDLPISLWAERPSAGAETFATPNATRPCRPIWPRRRVRSQLKSASRRCAKSCLRPCPHLWIFGASRSSE